MDFSSKEFCLSLMEEFEDIPVGATVSIKIPDYPQIDKLYSNKKGEVYEGTYSIIGEDLKLIEEKNQ